MLRFTIQQIRSYCSVAENANTRIQAGLRKRAFENIKIRDEDVKAMVDRRYIRSDMTYQPPSDVRKQIEKICAQRSYVVSNQSFSNETAKFRFFYYCHQNFKHKIPGKLFQAINSVEDVIKFYDTPMAPQYAVATHAKSLPQNLNMGKYPINKPPREWPVSFPETKDFKREMFYRRKYPNHDDIIPRYECKIDDIRMKHKSKNRGRS